MDDFNIESFEVSSLKQYRCIKTVDTSALNVRRLIYRAINTINVIFIVAIPNRAWLSRVQNQLGRYPSGLREPSVRTRVTSKDRTFDFDSRRLVKTLHFIGSL